MNELHGRRVFLDTNIVIHIVEGMEPSAPVLRALLEAVDSGTLTVVLSELTLAECLIKPLADERADLAAIYEAFVSPGAGREVIPVTRAVLREAARVRATAGIKLPDAIQVAAAAIAACDAFLTRDAGIRGSSVPIVLLNSLSA